MTTRIQLIVIFIGRISRKTSLPNISKFNNNTAHVTSLM
jgi:hypothetical protein